MKNIAIIPARSGSKRIKNKNIKHFHNYPIIMYPICEAEKSELFKKIHISTDSNRIKKIVERILTVDFLRPKFLSTNHTPLMPVLNWVLRNYASLNSHFDNVFLILPTAALIKAKDLKRAYKIYLKHKRKHPVMAVREYSAPIQWALRLTPNGILKPVKPSNLKIRSQDLEKTYHDSGTFMIFNAKHINKKIDKYIPYFLEKYKAIDIDTEEDFKLAKIIYAGLGNENI